MTHVTFEYLRQVTPEIDLPVGKNLADHVALFLPNFVYDKQLTFNPERDFTIDTLKEYILNGTGRNSQPNLQYRQVNKILT